MQLSLTYKRCSCGKCDSAKDCRTPNAKSINEKSDQQAAQSARHRTFSRARQSRPRARHSYGNQQHRLDHTYAAAEVTSSPVEMATTTMNIIGYHQINKQPAAEYVYKVNGNLALAATPKPKAIDLECRKRPRGEVIYRDECKENRPPLTEFNVKLKPYRKYGTINNNIEEVTTTTCNFDMATKLLDEQRRRWVAATALLELSQSRCTNTVYN